MGLLERVNAQLARKDTGQSRDNFISLDDWASLFQFGGVAYPLLQTTMGSVNQERIIANAVAALQGNSAIAALVFCRVQAFSQIRFQWTRFSGSQPGDLWGTPELKVLEHPWPGGGTANLLARMEVDDSLSGNAYMVRTRKDRIARLRPDQVIIVLGSQLDVDYPADAPDCEVLGYTHVPRDGKMKFYYPNEVAHFAPLPDPNFQFLGMSWMTPCIREIQADTLTTEHKARFFENSATPNLAIKFDPSVPIEHVRQFKALMEDEHRGAFNAYKNLYLGGGADPTVIGTDFKQLDFSATVGKGESRLAAAAGVPPSWVGFSEGLQGSSLNAGNFNSARRRFTDGCIWPMWASAAQALSSIVPPPDSGASLWFDSRVPFMREDAGDLAAIQVQQATTISTLVQQGFTAESVVKAVDNNDWSVLKHSGLVSVQLLPPGTETPALGNGTGAAKPAAATVSASNGQGPGGQ